LIVLIPFCCGWCPISAQRTDKTIKGEPSKGEKMQSKTNMVSIQSVFTFCLVTIIFCHLTNYANAYYVAEYMKPDSVIDEEPEQIVIANEAGPWAEPSQELYEFEQRPNGDENYWRRISTLLQGMREKKSGHKRHERLVFGRRAASGSACLFKLCPSIY